MKDDKKSSTLENLTIWGELARRVCDGGQITEDEALGVLRGADDQLLDILAAAYRVRHKYFGNHVHLQFSH